MLMLESHLKMVKSFKGIYLHLLIHVCNNSIKSKNINFAENMHEVSGLRSVSDLKRSTNRGKTYRPVYDPWVHKDRHSFTLRTGLNQPSLVVLVQTHRYILIIIQFCNDLRSTYISASAVEWRTDLCRNSSSPLNGLWLNFGFDKLI